MEKRVIDCVEGDILFCIQNKREYLMVNNNPVLLQDIADGTVKEISNRTLRRWYKFARTSQPVEPQPIDIEVAITETVVEPPPVNTIIENTVLTMDVLNQIIESLGCTTKHNKGHIAIKFNNKNVMEVYPTKKHMSLVFRESIMDDQLKADMVENYKGKVANKTWSLNYKVVTTESKILEKLLKLAIVSL